MKRVGGIGATLARKALDHDGHAGFRSLRLNSPTLQELEERTSGLPTCRRVRGGFSILPLPAGRRRMSQAWTLEV